MVNLICAFLSWLVVLSLANVATGFQPTLPCRTVRLTGRSFLFLDAKKTKGSKSKSQAGQTMAVNRVAYRNYEIIEKIEAGVSLKGTEVKSIRDGKLNLRDGYVRASKDGRSCVLHNVHIGKCTTVGAEYFQHEETRQRPLLIHKEQARKLRKQVEQQGVTIIPLKAYFNDRNRLKIEIALVRGKKTYDKRATLRERDLKREAGRIIKNFRM